MGNLEEVARKRQKRDGYQKAILTTIGLAGVLAVAAVAPNALQLLRWRNTKGTRSSASRALSRLIDKGLVKREADGRVFLTEKGQAVIDLEKESLSLVAGKRKWDGQWRIVIFDIPESRRKIRDNLRRHIEEIGFFRLQGSVWVFPYDCEELLALIKTDLRAQKEIIYMVVSSLENDKRVRDHFRLGAL